MLLSDIMGRRKRDSGGKAEDLLRAGLALLMLLAFAIGGIPHFAQALGQIVVALLVVLGVGIVAALAYALVRRSLANRRAGQPIPPVQPMVAASVPVAATDTPSDRGKADPIGFTPSTIRARLNEIDWYQFEKFCAALLKADGFDVERRGGAQPDGGVDLIVAKDGGRALIQCKHWRNWKVQERTVREMLGSMTALKTPQGAIYTLAGWTEPAAQFASQHAITLVNGDELAASAAHQLRAEQLEQLLDTSVHHCPKCESPMVWRTGAFDPFWGCSQYPRCRGKLNHSGAR